MRRLRPAALLALAAPLVLAAAPAPASAQVFTQISIGTGPGGAAPVTALESPVKVTGEVRVDFHGNGFAGTVTWNPGRRADLVALGFRKHGQRVENGFLSIGDDLGSPGAGATSERVRRDGGDLCADVGSSLATVDSPDRPGSGLALTLFGSGEVMRTRCAGPVGRDVAGLLPTRTIDERTMRRGGATLDFSADGEFSAHGLSGTVHSDLVLKVGKAISLLGGSRDELPGPTKAIRTRFLEVDFDVEQVSGQVVTSVQGLDDPDLCGPLDACGLAGTVTAAPSVSSGDGFLLAFGSAKHSRRDLERALGLVPGRPPRGVHRAGSFGWAENGTVTSDLTRAGAPACHDSAPLVDDGVVDLGFGRGSAPVRAAYSGLGALRTRCPGPDASDAGVLARGSIPLRELTSRRATLHLSRGGGAFSANGYRGSSRAALDVTVRRTHIRHFVEVDRIPRKLARPRIPSRRDPGPLG